MKEFEYQAAGTIDEAVSLLAARGDRARVLAGGTDLLVQLREGQREADLIVDVKKIPELRELSSTPAGLRIGAAVPCYRIYEHPQVQADYPGLVDAARIIGGWQIQSRASLGGNLCNASPAADSIPPLLVYEGVCQVAGPQGSRSIPAAEFCLGPGRNALSRGELLTGVALPPRPRGSGGAYQRFIPRNEMDIAVAGAGAWVQLDAGGTTITAARIALAAVAPTPVLAAEAGHWLAGQPATPESFARAGELAQRSARPISDKRGPAEYRRHLVAVLVARTLAAAVERARQRES